MMGTKTNEGKQPLLPLSSLSSQKHTGLWNLWHAKKLEPEHGDCPVCGAKDIEFMVIQYGDGRIRKLKQCPDCDVKFQEEERRREETARQAEIAGIRRRRTESSGIPPKFMGSDFSTFEKGWQDKALAVCKKYAKEYPLDKKPVGYPSLTLFSKNTWGVGKTHLSCAIALEIFKRWNGGDRSCPNIILVSESDLFRSIQATYSFNYDEAKTRNSEDDIIRKLVNCDLLVLDDVGKEKRADPRFVQRTLFGIIDGRYKLQLPMIITANVDPGGLTAHMEGASADRVFEMSQGKSIQLNGQSYRRKV